MARTKNQEPPIVRLTHWKLEATLPQKGSKELPKDGNRTIYGVDAEGNERIYAVIPPNRWEKWSKKDPLWIQAQSAMADHLMSNPITRDFVIMIHIQAALEKGDKKTAIKLWNNLSESARAKLIAEPEPKTNTDEENNIYTLSDVQKVWANRRKQGLNSSELQRLIIKQKGRCALSGALMIFDKACGTPKPNGQGCHPLYAAVDHVYPGKENGHQLVCYDLNDLKGHLPYKVFTELQNTNAWKKLMTQWRLQSEEDPMDISAFKSLLKD